MPGTTVRSAVPETKAFPQPWEDIKATIRPAGVVQERARQELVKHRVEAYEPDGAIRIESDVNTIDLWLEEIWLTYDDINVTNEAGERIFKARSDTNQAEFLKALENWNPGPDFLKAWIALVREVNPTWRRPFL